MEIKLDELKLQKGYNYHFLGTTFHHPTLQEIVDLENGYKEYSEMVYSLITSVKNIADILWCENKIWYEDIKSDWDFFTQREILTCRQMPVKIELDGDSFETEGMFLSEATTKALNYFLGQNFEYVFLSKQIENSEESQILFVACMPDEEGLLVAKEDSLKFTEIYYNELNNFLVTINWVSTENEIDFTKGGNRYSKEYRLKQVYKKRKRNKKPNFTFGSIISSLIGSGISYEEIWKFPIYEVYECYYRLSKIKDYENTSYAYYAGNIDTKKHPIKWEEINWSSVLNIKK